VLALAGRDLALDQMELLVADVEPGAGEAEVRPVSAGGEAQVIDVEADGRIDIVDIDRHVVHTGRTHGASVARRSLPTPGRTEHQG
jgi:hypothetical protein